MTSREPKTHTLAERIIEYLRSHPDGASDAALAAALGVRHQHVNQVCHRLEGCRIIARGKGERPILNRLLQDGMSTQGTWDAPSVTGTRTTAQTFEEAARRYFSELWGVELGPRKVLIGGAVEKAFDFVSADGHVVGDAKLYKTLAVPAAKWSTIAEYVWLLQHAAADRRFMVFGLDVDVPFRWLKRFGPLVDPVEFYFFDGFSHRRLWPR